jgi:hypothetical protein
MQETHKFASMTDLGGRGIWGPFPPEIYLLVADGFLHSTDHSTRGGTALLHLAMSSRPMKSLLDRWAATRFQREKRSIEKVVFLAYKHGVREMIGPSLQPLELACRIAGGICSFCHNRQDHREIFTGVPICQSCDAFWTPKISMDRFAELYRERAKAALWSGDSALRYDQKCHSSGEVITLFDWWDLKPRLLYGDRMGSNYQAPNGEDFGNFRVLNQKFGNLEEASQNLIKEMAFSRWDEALQIKGKPNLIKNFPDLILSREFRYVFDPSWTSDATLGRDYRDIASPWMKSTLWDYRPWSIPNFPSLPRSLETIPSVPEWKIRRSWLDFRDFQRNCAKIRKVLKRDPKILSRPRAWLMHVAHYIDC